MVERDSDLNQPLQESFFGRGCGSPYVFQNFVCFEKFAVIKQINTAKKAGLIHKVIVA